MRTTTSPIGALFRWLAVVGNVTLLVVLATGSWQYWPFVVLALALPWFSLLTLAPWRYRTRSMYRGQLRLLVFRRTGLAALVGAIGVAALALRFHHSWRAALVLFVVAKLSLNESMSLWAPRGFDPRDAVWQKGGGFGLGWDRPGSARDRSRPRAASMQFSFTWSTDFDDRLIEKAFRSSRWALLRPAATVVLGGFVLGGFVLAVEPVGVPLRLPIVLICAWLIVPGLWRTVRLELTRDALRRSKPVSAEQLMTVRYAFERMRNPAAAAAIARRLQNARPPEPASKPGHERPLK